ncbi:MAG: protoporphyrinogen/coproporphyrinogen oxidase [Turicibacter sp.]
MHTIKYLIIGGGVTGLSFANFINDASYLIIEKESTLGGYCKTTYVNDFIWDYAGHFFHFNNDEIKTFFLNRISESELVFNEKKTCIYYKDKLIDFPFQKNIHQLSKDEFIECLVDLVNKNQSDSPHNFKEMLYSKFGESIANKFLIPYNEKLYATDLEILDVDAMGRFFPFANLDEIIRNFSIQINTSYNNNFSYPKRGAQRFIEALSEPLDSSSVLLNEEIININYIDKCVTTTKRIIKYEYLINTMPFNQLLDILQIKQSSKLTCNQVLVFNIGFEKKAIDSETHWIYYPQKDINFYRVGFYNNILKKDKLSIYVEIGFSSDSEINIDEQYKLTLSNLMKVGIIESHQVISYESIVMNPAYVHISKDSLDLYNYYTEALNLKNIYSLGRYGGWKYCSIEDSMVDAKNLADKFNRLM